MEFAFHDALGFDVYCSEGVTVLKRILLVYICPTSHWGADLILVTQSGPLE